MSETGRQEKIFRLPMNPQPVSSGSRLSQGCWVALLAALLATLPACQQNPPEPVKQAPDPTPLVQVNGVTLTTRDLEEFVRLNSLDSEGPASMESALDELVTRQVVFQAAQAEGYEAEPEAIDTALQTWFGGQERGDASLRRQVEAFLVVQDFLRDRVQAEQEISLLDLQRYYEAHFDQFRVDDQVRVLEILVPERTQAVEIRSRLKAGDFRSFREIARAESSGLTADKGGELGVFQPGDLPQRFENLIFSLRVGEISPIFQSEHGFHLFVVEERTPRHEQKFYEVKDEIFRRLVAEAERSRLEELLTQLQKAAEVSFLVPGRNRKNGE